MGGETPFCEQKGVSPPIPPPFPKKNFSVCSGTGRLREKMGVTRPALPVRHAPKKNFKWGWVGGDVVVPTHWTGWRLNESVREPWGYEDGNPRNSLASPLGWVGGDSLLLMPRVGGSLWPNLGAPKE